MENAFCEVAEGIYRLCVPFDTVYTSVFLIRTASKRILVDCATTAEDVDAYIVPGLQRLGYRLDEIDMLVLTHAHDDHAGGSARILALAPRIEIITDVRPLCDSLSTYPLAGHTNDSIGVLDLRTNTLLSGDGLQGAGVDKYRCCVRNKAAYLETLERIRNDLRVEHILFSHAYEPWYRDSVHGREAVCDCLKQCMEYV